MWMFSGVVSIALLLMEAKAATPEEWRNTLDVVGSQPMLSQKMAKRFLQIAMAMNTTKNKDLLVAEIADFEKNNNDLANGKASWTNGTYNITGVIPQSQMGTRVQQGITDVDVKWQPFKLLLQNNMNTVRDANGNVDKAVIQQVEAQSTELFDASVALDNYVSVASQFNGAVATGETVTISRRQLMLIEKMAKEVLLLSLNVNAEANKANLQATAGLIDESNNGIILGAPWASVNKLYKFCTLSQMRQVTYNWQICKPISDEINAAATIEEARSIATSSAYLMVTVGEDLSASMISAISLIENDDGTCDVINGISTAEWKKLLVRADAQRYLMQKLSLLVLQVANDISTEATSKAKVDLTIDMAETNSQIRSLIEGSIANSIPSPPTQEIADALMLAYSTWQSLQREYNVVIYADTVNLVMVNKIVALSETIQGQMTDVIGLYMKEVKAYDPAVPADFVTVSGRQRMYIYKMAQESGMVNYNIKNGIASQAMKDEFLATRDLFLTIHWALLGGDAAMGLTETLDLCIIKKMKEVKDKFDTLEENALLVNDGDSTFFETMIDAVPPLYEMMNTAVTYYSDGVETCPEDLPNAAEWNAGLVAAGEARASSQKTGTDYLWGAIGILGPNPGMVLATFWGADGMIGEGMRHSINMLRFGWGLRDIPAPFNQGMRGEISKVWVVVVNFSRDLLLNSSSDVVFDSNGMLTEAEILMETYVRLTLENFPNVPARRIELACRQEYLANRMLKEACLIRRQESLGLAALPKNAENATVGFLPHSPNHGHTIVISRQMMQDTIAKYDEVTRWLQDGNEGMNVPKVTNQRKDIENQQERVKNAYETLKTNSMCVADPQCLNTLTTKQSLNDLEAELAAIKSLYFEEDPPEPDVFPWTAVLYAGIAGLIIMLCCFACWMGWRHGRQSGVSSSGDKGVASA